MKYNLKMFNEIISFALPTMNINGIHCLTKIRKMFQNTCQIGLNIIKNLLETKRSNVLQHA